MLSRSSVSLLCLCAAVAVSAQTVPDAGQISREVRGPERREPAPADMPLAPADAAADAAVQAGPKVRINEVNLTGNTQIPSTELQAVVQPLVGRTVTVGELRRAAAQLTEFYRARGFLLARAYLPPQEVTTGTVTFAVLEGRIGEVKIIEQPGNRLQATVANEVLAAARERTTAVRSDDLEAGLLLLNDYSGVAATAALEPGEEVGTTRVIVDLAPTALVDGSVQVDNHGSRYTGEWRAGAEARLNGLWGRGEQLTARALWSEDNGIRSGGLSFSLPLQPRWTVYGGFNLLAYEIGEDFSALGLEGGVTDYSAGLSWAAWRSRKGRLTFSLDASQRELEDRIVAFNTDNDRDVFSLTLRASGTHSDGWGAGGLFGFSAAVTAGDVELKSALQQALDSGPGGYGTAGGFSRFNVSGWRVQNLAHDWSLLASVRAQFSLGGNLDTSEKSLMGGPNGIRAYPVSEIAGDESVLGTVELRWDWRTVPWRGAAQFFGFVDAGSSRLRAEPLAVDVDNRRSLHAVGVGTRLQAGSRWELSGTVAWRGSEISQEDPTAGRARAFVTATTRF